MDIRLEKRLAPRRNTNMPAVIVFDAGKSAVECIIRNLSDTGARLEVFGTVARIPQSFELMVPRHRPQACRVAWRSLRELGVAFQPRQE